MKQHPQDLPPRLIARSSRATRLPVHRGSRLLVAVLLGSLVLAGLAVAPLAQAAAAPAAPAITPTNPAPGATITATGTLAPASPKTVRPVSLQRRQGTAWVIVTSAKTTTTAAYRFMTKAPTTPGAVIYRVYAKPVTVMIRGKRRKLPALTSLTRTVTVATPVTPDTTPPPTPTGLAASPGDTTVTVTWSPVTGPNTTDLAGYDLFQATSATGPWTTINTTPQTATSRTFTGLTNGTTYYYAVTAVDTTNNESAKSATALATPKAPTPDTTPPSPPSGLAALAGNAAATLSWSPVTASDLAGYHVYQAASSTGLTCF